MPDMDGYEVCKRLKESEQLCNIPVIFISASNETMNKVKAFGEGGVDYIIKPFQFEEVEARVTTHLALRRMQKELEDQNAHLDDLVRQKSRELAEAHDRLEVSNATKGDFLKLISHELRTPANGILGIADLLLENCAENSEVEEMRSLFHEARERMIETLDNALLLAQIHVSKDDFRAEPVALCHLLPEARQAAAELLRNTRVDFEALPTCEVQVLGDEKMMKTALTSLMQTAAAFTKPDQTVAFRCMDEGDRLVLTITGKGRGLDAEAASGFFDVFSTVRNTTYAEMLGLKPVVAERIISLYGGSVHMANLDPEGVELTIEFAICGN